MQSLLCLCREFHTSRIKSSTQCLKTEVLPHVMVWCGQWKSLFNSSLLGQHAKSPRSPKQGLYKPEKVDWSSFSLSATVIFNLLRPILATEVSLLLASQCKWSLAKIYLVSQWVQATTTGIPKQQSIVNSPQQPGFMVRCFLQQRAPANFIFVRFTNIYQNQCTASHLSLSLQSEYEDHFLLCDACTERSNSRKLNTLHLFKSTQM